MPFIVPDFKETWCMGIAACGDLDTEDDDVLELIERHAHTTYFASYKIDGGEAVLRLSLGGEGDRHVHLDAFKRELFPDEGRRDLRPLEELTDYLDRLNGQEIRGRTYGRTVLAINELPIDGIIVSTLYERQEEEVSIRTSDVRFDINGAPVRSMGWSLTENGKKIIIDIESSLSETIKEDYLSNKLSLIESAFRIFVMGERRHART